MLTELIAVKLNVVHLLRCRQPTQEKKKHRISVGVSALRPIESNKCSFYLGAVHLVFFSLVSQLIIILHFIEAAMMACMRFT